ncbi:hypothetical protein BKA56DRAFT_620018 [Ilyonectria sp. MPI-CAGE-AT-0026]|nr:hypothetical protein BKA56DRAFT_620018 [Ilyonectria sp. MPI-CAGE-AT-0026]
MPTADDGLRDLSCSYIQRWLDEAILDQLVPTGAKDHDAPNSHIHSSLNEPSDIVPPPPSTPPSRIRLGSPRKRRRPDRQNEEGDGTNHGDEVGHLEEDLDKTTRRSASPVETFTLQMLRNPVEFVELADDPGSQLPVEIQQLYRDIYDLAVDRERFIPKGLEKIVQGLVPGVKARYFSEEDEPYDSSTVSRELETLQEIKTDSQLCRSSNASEAAWNSDVHSPLLKTAVMSLHPPASALPSFPPCKRMVDYGIALHPQDGDPLDLSIRRALAHLPVHSHHLNQTAYGPIRFAANAVSIETKTGANGLQEARLQVGIWIAATQQEDRQGKENDQDGGESSRKTELLIPVPIIIVIEHEWKLFFACDCGNKIEIIGHVSIGDTMSLDGLFIIVAVIRRLATWIQNDFRTWLENDFG